MYVCIHTHSFMDKFRDWPAKDTNNDAAQQGDAEPALVDDGAGQVLARVCVCVCVFFDIDCRPLCLPVFFFCGCMHACALTFVYIMRQKSKERETEVG